MSEIDTYKVENINHLVEVGTKLYPFWFRGHSECFDELLPWIFRKTEVMKSQFAGGIEEHEFTYIEEYQRKVPMFTDQTPEQRGIEWLFMMQHYGAPTRLLDWTENVLVAAYFAVNENVDKDGEIWVIFPQRLNKHYGKEVFWLWDSPEVSYFAKEPFSNNPGKLAEELKVTGNLEMPLAFYPPLNNPRMVAQSSVFTIHPKPNDKNNNTITSLLRNDEKGIEVVRYIIAAKCKNAIRSDLNKLGINRTRLFPERESVAVDVVKNWSPRWGFPKTAPECGGRFETV